MLKGGVFHRSGFRVGWGAHQGGHGILHSKCLHVAQVTRTPLSLDSVPGGRLVQCPQSEQVTSLSKRLTFPLAYFSLCFGRLLNLSEPSWPQNGHLLLVIVASLSEESRKLCSAWHGPGLAFPGVMSIGVGASHPDMSPLLDWFCDVLCWWMGPWFSLCDLLGIFSLC